MLGTMYVHKGRALPDGTCDTICQHADRHGDMMVRHKLVSQTGTEQRSLCVHSHDMRTGCEPAS